MEPDLDRLLDFEAGGGLFPQFKASWPSAYGAARSSVTQMVEEGAARVRIAIKTLDPQSFSALFIALCRQPVDLFLFNPTWGRREEEEALELSDPHWIVGDFVSGDFVGRKLNPKKRGWSQKPERPFRVMIATGGSSGKIRFAAHDWSTLAAAAYGFQQHVECNRMASHCVLPLYHVSGFMQLVRALLTVGKVSFGSVEGFKASHAILESVESNDRFLSLVSTQLDRLLKEESNHELLRQYRAIFVGGGPTSIGLIEDCRELKIPIALTYGMTETAAQVATLLPERFLAGESNQGKPLPHAHIEIVSEDDVTQKLGPGEIGLVRIISTSLFKGYWGENVTGPKNSIVTSDLGRLEPNGSLSTLGRADGVIISGGEKVSLREVEICIEASHLVRDVIAFGLDDDEWGERLAVAYVPKEEFVSEEALQNAVRAELASFKFPKIWIRRTELPRNEAGKVIRNDLLAMASGS